MEVERLILEHATEGLRTMDPEVVRLVDDLHEINKTLLRDHWQAVLPEHIRKQRRFIVEILRRDGEVNRELAEATLAHRPKDVLSRSLEYIDGVNNLLDSLDERTLGPLRGEVDFMAKITEGHKVTYAARAGSFLEMKMPGSVSAHLSTLEAASIRIETRLNDLFFDNFLAKRIQQANTAFGNAVNSSAVASAGMKAVAVIQLADELPAYWNAFDQDSWEEGFSQLATTFFERRVPGGSSLKHVMIGNTGLACWDLFTAVFPPAALAYGAWGLAEAMAAKSTDYWWSSELELFADELYASATWEMTGVKRVGDTVDLSQWKLKTVTYNGNVIVIDDYLALKMDQIQEMKAALRVPFNERKFPTKYAAFDPFLGWFAADKLLRENLVRADNVLLLIDEERNSPHVGDTKLYDELGQRWTLRWEQVKVAFLARLIEQLQRRNSTEGLGAYQLAEILLELDAVTGELKVTDQVFASLGREAGFTELGSWMTWFRDIAIGGKRAAFEQAANETAFAKAIRVAITYLEVYTAVRDARNDTESLFVSDGRPAEDSGLRILSTPFLLTCNAGRDEAGYPRWARLPATKWIEVDDELQTIKRVFVPGARLDSEAESFDQKTLRAMTYHDVFKELWKTVQVASSVVQGSVTNLDFRLWWELSKQRAFGDNPELQRGGRRRPRLHHRGERDRRHRQRRSSPRAFPLPRRRARSPGPRVPRALPRPGRQAERARRPRRGARAADPGELRPGRRRNRRGRGSAPRP